MKDLYKVTVYYREPTYELATGPRAEPYSWTFEIEALSAEAARNEAMRQFDELARISSVGWVRRVERVVTDPPHLRLASA
jgi:hypothetical protein